jgi:hypothetical protein
VAKSIVVGVLVALALVGLLVGGTLWAGHAAELRSRTFCEKISVGSNVQSAVNEASSKSVLYGSIVKESGTDYSFYFPAVMFNKAVCYVSSDKSGTVISRTSIMEYD